MSQVQIPAADMAAAFDAGINFTHPGLEQPQAAPVATQQSAIPAPPQTPAEPATTAQQQQEAERLLAGKYRDVAALEKGYMESAQEAQRIVNENKALKAMLQTVVPQQPGERVNPAARAGDRTHVKALEEALVPVDALKEFFREQLMEEFKPLVAGQRAAKELAQAYGEPFGKFQAEMETFLSANPDVNDEYNRMLAVPGLEKTAQEMAFLKYSRALGSQAAQSADASGQAQAQARAVAMMSSGSVGARAVDSPQDVKLTAAVDHYNRTGDFVPFLSALSGAGGFAHPELANK